MTSRARIALRRNLRKHEWTGTEGVPQVWFVTWALGLLVPRIVEKMKSPKTQVFKIKTWGTQPLSQFSIRATLYDGVGSVKRHF